MKFLILTESAGNPRSFPEKDITQLEQTYPYLIRDKFKESTFWQLSYGNVTTEDLCSQAAGYLNHWDPDVIIAHSGLNDCRPEAFSDLQKTIIIKYSKHLFKHLKKYIFHPKLIKYRNLQRVSEKSFKKTVKKLQLIFSNSKIFWLEICASDNYEIDRPGVTRKIKDYNRIIENIYKEDFISIKDSIVKVDGFNIDNLHWNKKGHKVVANILLERINSHFNEK